MILSRLRRLVFVCVFVFTATSISSANPITLDFEHLTDSEELSSQFPDIVFSNALVLSAGISLNEFDFPPHSGSNVILDNGGAITVSFAQEVYALSGYFTYATPITLTAYDSSSNVIGSLISALNNNYQSSDTPSPNELLVFNSLVGIRSIRLSGDQSGGSFVLDDFTYDNEAPLVEQVPDPGSTLGLLLLGATAILATARRVDHSAGRK